MVVIVAMVVVAIATTIAILAWLGLRFLVVVVVIVVVVVVVAEVVVVESRNITGRILEPLVVVVETLLGKYWSHCHGGFPTRAVCQRCRSPSLLCCYRRCWIFLLCFNNFSADQLVLLIQVNCMRIQTHIMQLCKVTRNTSCHPETVNFIWPLKAWFAPAVLTMYDVLGRYII